MGRDDNHLVSRLTLVQRLASTAGSRRPGAVLEPADQAQAVSLGLTADPSTAGAAQGPGDAAEETLPAAPQRAATADPALRPSVEPSTAPAGGAAEEALLPAPQLPPEVETGNVEYKLSLAECDEYRRTKLASQMRWRLGEGALGGSSCEADTARYKIGYGDDGTPVGLKAAELRLSLECLATCAAAAGARVVRTERLRGLGGRTVASCRVERMPPPPSPPPPAALRLAVLGTSGAGKSSLVSVLGRGASLDNGAGAARCRLVRHVHELHGGTAGVRYHHVPLGPGTALTAVDTDGASPTATARALTGGHPDAVLVVVAADDPRSVLCEHLGMALALGVRLLVVVTKADAAAAAAVVAAVAALLASVGRVPRVVVGGDGDDDAGDCDGDCGGDGDGDVPVYTVSAVTGLGLDGLRRDLCARAAATAAAAAPGPLALEATCYDEIAASAGGSVLAATVTAGAAVAGGEYSLGPFRDGAYRPVTVVSIHLNGLPIAEVGAGRSATFAVTDRAGLPLEPLGRSPRGLRLCSGATESFAPAATEFDAEITLLKHSAYIAAGKYQPVLHIGNAEQAATLLRVGDDGGGSRLAVGQTAVCAWRFLYAPEAIRVGDAVVLREGATRGTGRVVRVGGC